MRALIHYALAAGLLTFYGREVCSFLETLAPGELSVVVSLAFTAALGLRGALLRRVVLSAPLLDRARCQFALDFTLFLLAASVVGLYDALAYDFPIASGVKLMIGALTLGFFAGLDLALERERMTIREAHGIERRMAPDARRASLTRRMMILSLVATGLVTVDLLLIIVRDIGWIALAGMSGVAEAQRRVVTEILFVAAVLAGFLANLVFSFTRNLRIFFAGETTVLEAVTRGELDRFVPVSSHDEFGVIAHHTNQMIEGLRERELVKDIFGKVVSPEIARRLLAQGREGLMLGGTRRRLVVLFADIRNFTAWTERTGPEKMVEELNAYFFQMVACVREHQGIVDKFIGDGILAVFGLDEPEAAADRAVRCALAMQDAVVRLGAERGTAFSIGIGIDAGELTAGNFGAPDRLEFTFIGDVVNTASRLEALSKDLTAQVLISGSVHGMLNPESLTLPWTDLGERDLRGKKRKVQVFGLIKTLQLLK